MLMQEAIFRTTFLGTALVATGARAIPDGCLPGRCASPRIRTLPGPMSVSMPTSFQTRLAITSGPKLTDGGGQTGIVSNGFVTFSGPGLGDFNKVVLSSTQNAFEVADLEAFGPNARNQVSGVPETSTWFMMILGFFGVGLAAYRRKGTTMEFRIA
jgi:hypothetical protein